MKKMLVVLPVIVATVCSCISTKESSRPTYEIFLTGPCTVGDVCRLSIIYKCDESMKLSTFDEVLKSTSDKYAVELNAYEEVHEVNTKKRPTRVTLNIIKFIKVQDIMRRTLLPEGTIVEISVQNGTVVYEINGRPLGEVVKSELSSVYSLETSDISDDDIFGTSTPKGLGDTWEVNSNALVLSFKNKELSVQPEDVSGTLSLNEIVRIDSKDYLRVEGNMSIKKVVPLDLPPNMEVSQSSATARLSRLIPVRLEDHVIEDQCEMSMTIRGRIRSAPDAPKAFWEGDFNSSTISKYFYSE